MGDENTFYRINNNNVEDVPYFADYTSLRSTRRTSHKMHNKEVKNIYKSHWSISRIFWGNLFDKIQHQQQQTCHLERQFKIKIE